MYQLKRLITWSQSMPYTLLYREMNCDTKIKSVIELHTVLWYEMLPSFSMPVCFFFFFLTDQIGEEELFLFNSYSSLNVHLCCFLPNRKVKYFNVKGSFSDPHTIRGLTKGGKEVSCFTVHLSSAVLFTSTILGLLVLVFRSAGI